MYVSKARRNVEAKETNWLLQNVALFVLAQNEETFSKKCIQQQTIFGLDRKDKPKSGQAFGTHCNLSCNLLQS